MASIYNALLIDSSKETVYAAITDQSGLSSWWTPDASTSGQINSIARFSFGPYYYKEMEIKELNPFVSIVWRCTAGADEWIGTEITFELSPYNRQTFLNLHPEIAGQMEQQASDKGTFLLLKHEGWDTYSPMFAECSYTWGQFLRSLKLFCETGKGRPWPKQHRI